jgi:hypothetical protein
MTKDNLNRLEIVFGLGIIFVFFYLDTRFPISITLLGTMVFATITCGLILFLQKRLLKKSAEREKNLAQAKVFAAELAKNKPASAKLRRMVCSLLQEAELETYSAQIMVPVAHEQGAIASEEPISVSLKWKIIANSKHDEYELVLEIGPDANKDIKHITGYGWIEDDKSMHSRVTFVKLNGQYQSLFTDKAREEKEMNYVLLRILPGLKEEAEQKMIGSLD